MFPKFWFFLTVALFADHVQEHFSFCVLEQCSSFHGPGCVLGRTTGCEGFCAWSQVDRFASNLTFNCLKHIPLAPRINWQWIRRFAWWRPSSSASSPAGCARRPPPGRRSVRGSAPCRPPSAPGPASQSSSVPLATSFAATASLFACLAPAAKKISATVWKKKPDFSHTDTIPCANVQWTWICSCRHLVSAVQIFTEA